MSARPAPPGAGHGAAGARPEPDPVPLDTVTAALEALRAGRPVIVVDDADRENEGDVVLAAELATAQWVGWTVRHSSGLICAPMPAELADRFELPPMVEHSQDPRRTAYTVTVDAAAGITTGISATDRTRTLRVLADPHAGPGDLIRPGHVLPLRARPGGVLERPGHTEAAVDLCRLAGLAPVGVICEVVGDDGELLRLPALRDLADRTDLPLISIADLAAHRRALSPDPAAHGTAAHGTTADVAPPGAASGTTARVRRGRTTRLPTPLGEFTAHGYLDLVTGAEHVALVHPGPAGTRPDATDLPQVRVHSECLTGDAFGSLRCDCGPQLEAGLAAVAAHGGALVYLRGHEGRGIGLLAKLHAYALQDQGLDTVAANLEQGLPADAREYGAAAAVLRDLGLTHVALLTNNPDKVDALRAEGVHVVRRVGLQVGRSPHNLRYLRAKRDLMGHRLDGLDRADTTTSHGAHGAGKEAS